MARVSLIDPETADETVQNNAKTNSMLFTGSKTVNSQFLMAHTPHVAKFISCIVVALQREGAGSILSGRIKSITDIKTSSVNSCAY